MSEKIVLVTGSSDGIGKETAKELAENPRRALSETPRGLAFRLALSLGNRFPKSKAQKNPPSQKGRIFL